MKRCAGAWWMGLGLCYCASNGDQAPDGGVDAGVQVLPGDRDGDGLCDDTERATGTDADSIDSDFDSLPDAFELAVGLDPLSNLSPDPSRIVRLDAIPGSQVTFEPRATAQGGGGNFTGRFEPLPAVYALDHDASTFLDSAQALAAEPPDNIRALEGEAQRFVGVIGTTRLRFRLRFTYRLDSTLPCAIAHAFGYPVREEGEGFLQTPIYLLLLVPPGGFQGADDFCKPANCF